MKKNYRYSDFTKYYDIEFIENVFIKVLKREVDKSALEYYLKLLRSGENTKDEIITSIRYSHEGKKKGVKIIGSLKEYIINTVCKLPFLGKIFKWTISILTLPLSLRGLDRDIIKLERRVFELEQEKLKGEEKYKFDNLYLEFENRFRGSRDIIKERMRIYLPYVKNIPFEKKDILDIGSGRGEWLEILKENGFSSIMGVDINRVMVAESRGLGLDVIEFDGVEYLKSLKENSLSIITGFHIIEHLSFDIMMSLFRESYRVLKSGGMIIFETPNPENIVVGSCEFYTDITHVKPLVPKVIKFLVKQNMFRNIEIKRLHPKGEKSTISSLEIRRVVDLVNCEQDYAVIAYK